MNTSINSPMAAGVLNLFSLLGNMRQVRNTSWITRLCIASLLYASALSSPGFGATLTLLQDVKSVGASVTAANSPYISAGYDLYSTSNPSNNSESGMDGNGAFSQGNRLSSLPSFITSVTSAGVNSSAAGFAGLYTVIDDPTGGLVQAGFTYNFTPTPSEAGLVNITIGNGAPSSFDIGALINTAGSGDDNDDMQLKQTTGGTADSGLIYTKSTNLGGVDVVLFQGNDPTPGDVYTLSGLESEANSDGKYHVSLAGLTFATSAALPEPSSGLLFVLGLVGMMSFYRIRQCHPTVSA